MINLIKTFIKRGIYFKEIHVFLFHHLLKKKIKMKRKHMIVVRIKKLTRLVGKIN
jgi:hypothetical protein